jgi:hypothetical protein
MKAPSISHVNAQRDRYARRTGHTSAGIVSGVAEGYEARVL